jgi:AraC family transcriptional regulator
VNEVHAATARDYTMCAVRVSSEVMDELLSEAGFAVSGAYAGFRSTVVRDPVIADLVGSVAEELAEARPGQIAMVGSLVRQLGVHLLREHLVVRRAPQMEFSRAGPVDRRLRRAIELMHENYNRDLDLEEIAGAAYLSSFYFQRLFKRLMGVSPHEYLANIRMERARALLLSSNQSVTAVARAVGFRSQSHFARIFRAANGVSPLAFRASATAPPDEA